MTFAWGLLAVAAAVILYWFGLRPVLRSMPALAGVWAQVDKLEGALWARSRTILAARLMWIPAALLAAHDFVASVAVDWTPITARLLAYLPEAYRPIALPIGVALAARFFEYLRKITTQPLDQKGPA